MGRISKIGWTTSTWNPWRGCDVESPACAKCYAWRSARRSPGILGVWGPEEKGGTRIVAARAKWLEPLQWDREARESGAFWPVFSASIADIFEQWRGPMLDSERKGDTIGDRIIHRPIAWSDYEVGRPGFRRVTNPDGMVPATMDDVLIAALDVMRCTPNLTWLVLTKRIADVMDTLKRLVLIIPKSMEALAGWIRDWIFGIPPRNLWLGCTAENQEWLDRRAGHLLAIPNVRPWISWEPGLGALDVRKYIAPPCSECIHSEQGRRPDGTCSIVANEPPHGNRCHKDGIRWVVAGGESGLGARPFDLSHARDLRDQCKASSIPYFFKQTGDHPVEDGLALPKPNKPHGADPAGWPEDLRIQEYPPAVA